MFFRNIMTTKLKTMWTENIVYKLIYTITRRLYNDYHSQPCWYFSSHNGIFNSILILLTVVTKSVPSTLLVIQTTFSVSDRTFTLKMFSQTILSVRFKSQRQLGICKKSNLTLFPTKSLP